MSYIVVTSPNGRSHYLAKQKIGGGSYTTVATFLNEQMARDTARVLNQFDLNQTDLVDEWRKGFEKPQPQIIKGGRR